MCPKQSDSSDCSFIYLRISTTTYDFIEIIYIKRKNHLDSKEYYMQEVEKQISLNTTMWKAWSIGRLPSFCMFYFCWKVWQREAVLLAEGQKDVSWQCWPQHISDGFDLVLNLTFLAWQQKEEQQLEVWQLRLLLLRLGGWQLKLLNFHTLVGRVLVGKHEGLEPPPD